MRTVANAPCNAPESDNHAADPHDDANNEEKAATLTQEGQFSKACSALLDEPPAPYSEAVVKEM